MTNEEIKKQIEERDRILNEVLSIRSFILAWCRGDKRNLEMVETDDPERGEWIKRKDVIKVLKKGDKND